MKTDYEMPATLLRQRGEEDMSEEWSRAAHERPERMPVHAQGDDLDPNVFHVGYLVEVIVRRL